MNKEISESVTTTESTITVRFIILLYFLPTKGTDPEATLRDSFKMFDPEGTGKLAEE